MSIAGTDRQNSGTGAPETAALAAILFELRARTGVDFSRYRSATVERRILNRMISVGVRSHESYLELLRASAAEAQALLSRVSIKVSRFYRNPASFDALREEVLPALRGAGHALRIWSAGCGCGEEAYTLAALLEELELPGSVLATDIDGAALDAARGGVYPRQSLADLPPALAQRYFTPVRQRRRELVAVSSRLARRVRFARHDLLREETPAGAPYDLVCCRNVLIYLQGDVREEVLQRVFDALRPGGCLFLGEAEWPPERLAARLEPVNRNARLFAAVQGGAA